MSKRCPWCVGDDLMMAYHDDEWGVPVHDDRKLFEFLVLDAFQAGLSWATILRRRESFRRAFACFDAEKVAGYTKGTVAKLLRDPSIIRNSQKILAAVSNAGAFLRVEAQFGSFDRYIWQFVDGAPRQNEWKTPKQLPTKTSESEEMSRALRERGFKFVGPTICYAFMQAAGLVNDHLVSCYRYPEVRALGSTGRTPHR